jgi:hypothetical protein
VASGTEGQHIGDRSGVQPLEGDREAILSGGLKVAAVAFRGLCVGYQGQADWGQLTAVKLALCGAAIGVSP